MYKLWLKTCSVAIILALLINMLPMGVFAQEFQESLSATEQAEMVKPEESAEEAYIVKEVTENRTEFSKEFQLSNGLRMAAVYADAVHYETENGWEEIDNTLTLQIDGTYATTAGVWDVRFPSQLTKTKGITLEKDGYTLSFYMAGELISDHELMAVPAPTVSQTQEVLTETVPEITATETVPETTAEAVIVETISETVAQTTEETFSSTTEAPETTVPVEIPAPTLEVIPEASAEELTVAEMQLSTAAVQPIDFTIQKQSVEHPEIIPEKASSRLRYDNIYQNTNVVYDLSGNQVKESIILSKYNKSLRGYRYTLDVGSLRPVLNEDGSIYFYNEEQTEIVMVMPAPYLVDANQDYCDDITVSLSGKDSTYTMTYQLPTAWLAASDRAWPVVVDPLVYADITPSNIRDHTVAESSTYSYTWGIGEAGYYNTGGIHRYYLKYQNLPALTSADVVVAASIQLNKYETSALSAPVEVHKVLSTWESETLTWANKPSFNQNIEDYAIVKELGWYSWMITDVVRDWYTGQNTGMLFKVSNEVETGGVNNFKQFYSSDWGSNKPILTICFRNNNGLESYWDYTASSAGRAGTGYINNFTGNLVFVRDDIGFGGNRMPVSISHVYNANDAQNNEFGLGNGWRTNFNQKVYLWSTNNSYYVWEDADGTRHYFKYSSANTYKDEDGLEMTLTTNGSGTEKYCITDKNGNCSYFDTYGRLVRMANNQATKSSINITYTTASGMRISSITDGVGRVYQFVYDGDDLLSRIAYRAKGTTDISYVNCAYDGMYLQALIDPDEAQSFYGYTNGLLSYIRNDDGYELTYTYYPVTDATYQPYRVQSVSESDGTAQGGSLTMAYAHNQTTFTDHNGNVEIHQFNDYGNTTCIQDDEGHAQYAQFARNTDNDSGKTNQLTLSSKLQNTVGTALKDGSFEDGTLWTCDDTDGTGTISTTDAYIGNKSFYATATAPCNFQGDYYASGSGVTYVFSAYVKVVNGTANLAIRDGSYLHKGETVNAGSGWVRLQVAYTNPNTSVALLYPTLCLSEGAQVYMDCVQVENADTASRYNLTNNGAFQVSGSPSYGWTASDNTVCEAILNAACAPQANLRVIQMVGSPTGQKRAYQTVAVSGVEGDCFTLGGWAKGDSVPLTDDRQFAIIGTFHYTDDTEKEFVAQFNSDTGSDVNWQYSAQRMVAEKAYDAITVEMAYDYNANTVYFDAIQLYKEEFGSSYTYDEDGNVISVTDLQKQTTTYEYANNDLTKIIENGNTKMSYDYDDYHNVETATTQEGLTYNFTYDTYGNNTAVSISKDDITMSSSATYTTDGNRLESTTDALGEVTTYYYDDDTNMLTWVQYPNDIVGTDDEPGTSTAYLYDDMYRLRKAICVTDSELYLNARYTYRDDRIDTIQTPSTTYHFTYGDFGLRDSVSAGTMTLASYEYTDDANRYLSMLDYGNEGSVEYTYDNKGRLLTQTYEDGDTVTYTYDNNGALATMVDHATGITTTYYYDLLDRMMKYVESGTGYSHGVEYTYDEKNNLKKLEENINGVNHVTEYDYDDDNRIETVIANGATITYTYDDFGRVTQKVTAKGEGTLRTESYTYVVPESGKTSAQVATHTIVTGNTTQTFTYTYDGNGNITSISDGTYTTTYAYDSANQLIQENNQAGNYTYSYTYDNAGNITERGVYGYSPNLSPDDVAYYEPFYYEDSDWGDLLTEYYSHCEYDEIGNLTQDETRQYTWEHGRQLSSMTNYDGTWEFTYSTDGMRTERTDGTTTYNYIYNGSQLTQMTVDGYTLTFFYDAEGKPSSFTYYDGTNTNTYYYATNLQGDVTGIFQENGTFVVNYTYDAWGRVRSVTGEKASTLGRQNPLRYRGYVYDEETGLYYLQSRYYNPEFCRFINADGFVATGQSFVGNNMFAYCNNNPVMLEDSTGTRPILSTSLQNENIDHKKASFAYMRELSQRNALSKNPKSLTDTGSNVSTYSNESDASVIARMLYGEDHNSMEAHLWVLENRRIAGNYGGTNFRSLILAENQFSCMDGLRSLAPMTQFDGYGESIAWEACVNMAFRYIDCGISAIPKPFDDFNYTYTHSYSASIANAYPNGVRIGNTWFYNK